VLDELVTQHVELPGGALELRQPSESAELPDDGGVEWAPIAPYWSVLWRSGVALARELERRELRGMRLVELGCGLGVPAIVAARRGAAVLATDSDPEALELLALNAERNDARLETARVDWAAPDELLLPRLAPTALIADPGRPPAEAFLEGAAARAWRVATDIHGVVRIYRMELAARAAAG
jgi:SAM-dependent methyltransferase